jgi:hypothetical protein
MTYVPGLISATSSRLRTGSSPLHSRHRRHWVYCRLAAGKHSAAVTVIAIALSLVGAGFELWGLGLVAREIARDRERAKRCLRRDHTFSGQNSRIRAWSIHGAIRSFPAAA